MKYWCKCTKIVLKIVKYACKNVFLHRILIFFCRLQSASFQLRVIGVEVSLPKDIYEEWSEKLNFA